MKKLHVGTHSNLIALDDDVAYIQQDTNAGPDWQLSIEREYIPDLIRQLVSALEDFGTSAPTTRSAA